MSIQFQIEEMPGYLAVKFTGVGAAEEVWRRFEEIAVCSNRASKNKLLIDFTETHLEFSLLERFWLGDQAETFKFHHLIKVAAVGRPEQLDCKKFAEMVARNRGINARTFTNVRAAGKWLLLKPTARRKRAQHAIIIPRNPADHVHR